MSSFMNYQKVSIGFAATTVLLLLMLFRGVSDSVCGNPIIAHLLLSGIVWLVSLAFALAAFFVQKKPHALLISAAVALLAVAEIVFIGRIVASASQT